MIMNAYLSLALIGSIALTVFAASNGYTLSMFFGIAATLLSTFAWVIRR